MNSTGLPPIPEGFKLLNRGGPFIAMLGPLYYRKQEQGNSIIALRIEDKHLNIRGIAHGGMLVTLADSALGIALSMSRTPPQPMVTVNLTTDFVDSAHPGDWVEAHVDIQRVGKRMAFANCYLHVGEKRILRASGVFALMPPHKPQEGFEG
ncbi:MAG: PaaI family thioesterase [Rhodocyclaceae bacterium]|nr:MAG: PaaI family thioesterase [Rhodocyclaceae bacterium]